MSIVKDVAVPDIGDFKNIAVIEILVQLGDEVAIDTPLLTLESDKATMEVPAPFAGTVKAVLVAPGDSVSMGTPIVTVEASDAVPVEPDASKPIPKAEAIPVAPPSQPAVLPPIEVSAKPVFSETRAVAHASPSVRHFARELGVAIEQVDGTGPKGRILRDDLLKFVKSRVQNTAQTRVVEDIAPWPQVDFAKFGPIERMALSRIRKISGPNLARNWRTIPHVTNFDEADVTDLEAFRQKINAEQDGKAKLTMLAFLIKASIATLKAFPEFNASLDGEDIIVKRYFNLGFAADTPGGLVVPVIRDADSKGLLEIATEMATLSASARQGKLKPADMQGGTFSVSSLGGIGGTGFTPIINAPDVAILGAAKTQMKPIWDGTHFRPRLMLPVSLSWDHRVVDGAAAGRFLHHLTGLLGDFRRLAL